MLKLPKQKVTVALPDTPQKQPLPLPRVAVAIAFVSLAVAAAAAGTAAIGYRLTHLVIDNGVVNGRIAELQTPVGGKVKAFYARPGVAVKSGQVLTRIDIVSTPQEDDVRLQSERSQNDQIHFQLERSQLTAAVQTNATQLATARQSLNFLQSQLPILEGQYHDLQGVDVHLASEDLRQKQAAVEQAVAKATSARLEYERYAALMAEGGASKQQTDQLLFAWKSAEAEVKQAQATLRSAQTSLSGSQKGIVLSNQNNNLQGTLSDQQAKLLQAIQTQTALVRTLEAQLNGTKAQLNQAESLYKSRPPGFSDHKSHEPDSQEQAVTAPFASVVYSTEREQGEQVNRLDPILTLLDCNDIWVEAIIPADQASHIDTQKPASVKLAGYSQTIAGEIDLMQPISSIQSIEQRKLQVQALLPVIAPELVGQALIRVTVRIPPPPQYIKSGQFCGVGQVSRLTFSKI